MLFKLGRVLQAVGLVISLLGVSGNVARPEQITVQDSLTIAGVGMVVFGVGWLLQQAGRPR
jgi:hypothetical protein